MWECEFHEWEMKTMAAKGWVGPIWKSFPSLQHFWKVTMNAHILSNMGWAQIVFNSYLEACLLIDYTILHS